ncbi:MAG TPA: NADH-quinone oxidoreductase subunit J [Pirellulales bacterium]|nr:NADH-quinone oxidoreductase subunit J [Pirellulales bacterium]
MNWHSFFFLLFAAISCGFAVMVVLSSNIVRMAFYLIVSLGATAGLFFLAGADFVAAMQLMIYVGGTLVLLVFGVMLTAQSPFVSMKTSGGDWILAFLLSGSLLAFLIPAAFSVSDWREGATPAVGSVDAPPPRNTADRLGLGLLGVRVDKLEDRPAMLRAGMAGYLLPFEIVSVHLLVVLVGAAYLARTKRRAG